MEFLPEQCHSDINLYIKNNFLEVIIKEDQDTTLIYEKEESCDDIPEKNVKDHLDKNQCEICFYTATRPSHLKRHMMKHTGEKPFKCDICGGEFSRIDHYKKHVMRHTGEKPFKCNLCDYGCTRGDRLKRHMFTHKNKNFKCSTCNYYFSDSISLNKHYEQHHQKWTNSNNNFKLLGNNEIEDNLSYSDSFLQQVIY